MTEAAADMADSSGLIDVEDVQSDSGSGVEIDHAGASDAGAGNEGEDDSSSAGEEEEGDAGARDRAVAQSKSLAARMREQEEEIHATKLRIQEVVRPPGKWKTGQSINPERDLGLDQPQLDTYPELASLQARL